MKQLRQYSFFIFGTSKKARDLAVTLASSGHTVTVSQRYLTGDYDALIFIEDDIDEKKLSIILT